MNERTKYIVIDIRTAFPARTCRTTFGTRQNDSVGLVADKQKNEE